MSSIALAPMLKFAELKESVLGYSSSAMPSSECQREADGCLLPPGKLLGLIYVWSFARWVRIQSHQSRCGGGGLKDSLICHEKTSL